MALVGLWLLQDLAFILSTREAIKGFWAKWNNLTCFNRIIIAAVLKIHQKVVKNRSKKTKRSLQ